jgi:23S rRNA pseudouridine2605 synthase
VNGDTATVGMRVTWDDDVRLDGKRLWPRTAHLYFLYYKPRGVLTTLADPRGRPDLSPVVARIGERVFPVGRLDRDSEGLLLLTNDGDLAQRLMHPRHEVPKTYLVTVRGHPKSESLAAIARGLDLPGLKTRPCQVRVLATEADRTRLEVVLREGKRRQIRLMFQAFGHEVLRLRRTAIGGLVDPGLRPGEVRRLGEEDLAALWSAGEEEEAEKRAGTRPIRRRDRSRGPLGRPRPERTERTEQCWIRDGGRERR